MTAKQPFVGAVAGVVAAKVLPAVVDALIRKHVEPAKADKIAADAAKDPAVLNQLNAEKPWQSRVTIGAVTVALSTIIPYVAPILGWNITEGEVAKVIDAVITLWGVGYIAYGRYWPGLKPLFHRD